MNGNEFINKSLHNVCCQRNMHVFAKCSRYILAVNRLYSEYVIEYCSHATVHGKSSRGYNTHIFTARPHCSQYKALY